MYLISLTGNIAAGKTFVIEYLKKHRIQSSLVVFIPEPILDTGRVTLESYYKAILKKDQQGIFEFQRLMMIKRLEQFNACIRPETKVVVVERTIADDVFIFAKNLYKNDLLTEAQWKLLVGLFDILSENTRVPSIVVYLDTDVDVCLARIKSRGRVSEAKIDREFLEELDIVTKDYVAKLSGRETTVFTATNLESCVDKLNGLISKYLDN
jgi:deoxyadenosine/deoxycytidine kinase